LVNVGIDTDRLSIKAFGESMPKASNDSKEGRAINRRVEFKAVN
jgi:OOP family OmpA-OmpF porin